MKWTCLASLCVVAALCSGAKPAVSSSSPASATDDLDSPPPSAPPHAISATTSARLTATLPKFSPRSAAGSSENAQSTDLRETDRPRNAIIRLPRYEVLEKKLPIFRERELLTDKGRVDLAFKRHPGLKFGPLAFLNAGPGLQMLEEEQQAERNAEMAELIEFQRLIETELAPHSEESRTPSPTNPPALPK